MDNYDHKSVPSLANKGINTSTLNPLTVMGALKRPRKDLS